MVPAGADKAQTLARFGEALRFPRWYGHNLDALADCLHDLASREGGPRLVVWDGVAVLREHDRDTYESICGVLDEVSEEHWRLPLRSSIAEHACAGRAGAWVTMNQ